MKQKFQNYGKYCLWIIVLLIVLMAYEGYKLKYTIT